jgi:hypothetical protein
VTRLSAGHDAWVVGDEPVYGPLGSSNKVIPAEGFDLSSEKR